MKKWIALPALLVLVPVLACGAGVTAKTPMGDIAVSCLTAKVQDYPNDGIQGTSYVSTKYKYVVSWPKDGTWDVQEKKPPDPSGVMLVLITKDAFGNFKPNINIIVEEIPASVTIGQYLTGGVASLNQNGFNVVADMKDDETSSCFVASTKTIEVGECYLAQRAIISHPYAYVITGVMRTGDVTPDKVRKDLSGILNSFRLLK